MRESFGIQLGDVFLDVSGGQMLTIEWLSSFFNEERVFAGSYSYEIVLPFTDKNVSALSNGQLLENRHHRKKHEVNIQLFGQSWKRAELRYDVASDGFKGSLLIDVGVVAEWMRERTVASCFTVTKNGKFVSFVELKGKGTENANKAWVSDSQSNVLGTHPFVFAPYRNDMALGEMIGDENAPFNDWLVNPSVNGVNNFNNTLWCPLFYLHWLIREVCSFLGFTCHGSFMDDKEIARWVIYNTGYFHSDDLKKPTFSISPAKHLPLFSIADFMKLLRNDFQVRVYFDSNTREAFFIKSDDLLQSDSKLDLSGQMVVDTLVIKHNPTEGYELVTKIDDGDEMNSIFPYVRSFTIGSTETPKPIELQSAYTQMFSGIVSGTARIRCPWVRQSPNLYGEMFVDKSDYNPPNTYSKNSFGFRLLAYRGIQPIAGASSFPFLNSDDKDTMGKEGYKYSVSPAGENGYLNRFCLGWYNYLVKTEQLDFVAQMKLKDFLSLSPLRKIIVSSNSFARTAALIDRVTFEPSEQDDMIDARILAFAQYNLMAITDDIGIAFEDGEIVIPELKIYARLTPEGEYYRINKSKEKEKWAKIYVSFYRDSAGTIPYAVTDMNVYYEGHETSGKGTDVTRNNGPFKVSGTKAFLREDMTWRWVKSTVWNGWTGTDRNQTFRLLENGKLYTVI